MSCDLSTQLHNNIEKLLPDLLWGIKAAVIQDFFAYTVMVIINCTHVPPVGDAVGRRVGRDATLEVHVIPLLDGMGLEVATHLQHHHRRVCTGKGGKRATGILGIYGAWGRKEEEKG